ncbi:MAG: nuclear transport factor 2 family protein [Actinomycetota bacterium]|nr:nuclear transport factor 2 family protein [Actinomycetota bacterium]
MTESRVQQLLSAVDARDVDAAMRLVAPDCSFLTADGRSAEGADATRSLLGDFLGTLRSLSHRITAEWHQDEFWIAEVQATYVMQDWLQVSNLRRAFFLREGPDGITELRVYGAHERPLTDHRSGEEGMWIADRWMPPL